MIANRDHKAKIIIAIQSGKQEEIFSAPLEMTKVTCCGILSRRCHFVMSTEVETSLAVNPQYVEHVRDHTRKSIMRALNWAKVREQAASHRSSCRSYAR